MAEIDAELESAYESSGYDVAEISHNRKQLRVELLDDEASAEDLRKITYDVVDESDVLGLDISTASSESQNELTTVVSFRYRG
ncbi:hypothetical protein ACFQJ7_00450 [Halovenus rubra]|uniref:Protein jag n=2 Tax=Halovenus rubra TaxID=869890 RepID=A0ABD5X3G4_9EURY|nr:hypothetical protein [Halovenus rubra]